MAESAPVRSHGDREETVQRAVEAAIRIGIVALIGLWVFQIVGPFIQPIVWGAIIAVDAATPYHLAHADGATVSSTASRSRSPCSR